MQHRCKCLQNGGLAIVRLTSGGESPYFSKLDSSFCQIGPHDSIASRDFSIGIEVAVCAEWVDSYVGLRSRAE